MAKSERGKRTRDCNLINPRLEVAQPVDRKRSRSLLETSIGPLEACGRKGIARRLSTCPADRCARIHRAYASDEFSRALTHQPRFRYSSASLIAIERTRPHRTGVQALKYARGRNGGSGGERGGFVLGRVREQEEGDRVERDRL